MAVTTLAEELALLSYNNEGFTDLSTPALEYGLAGAVLLDLVLARRVDVVEKRLVVTDRTPLGQPVLDDALDRIWAAEKARKPRDWVDQLSKGVHDRVLGLLVEAGVLRRDRDKVLWIFPRTRFPAPHGVEPTAETEARRRLTTAVAAQNRVDPRTAALCGLVGAVGLERTVFPDQPLNRVRARLEEIGGADSGAEATKRAIEEVQAAVAAAVTTATVVTTTNT